MMTFYKPLLVAAFAAVISCALSASDPLYSNDFTDTEPGSIPDDFLVIDGLFTVKEEDGNRFLELPGAPLETFGFIFGPAQPDGLAVSARVYGTSSGRRYPGFAVSLGGVGGHRLQVTPAKRAVELLRGDVPLTSVPYEWNSETWTHLKLQIRKSEENLWHVEGKAWAESEPEPDAWSITLDQTDAPISGRPGAWGIPFSVTPIRFDDLKVVQAQP
jgi:hypothetical protein